MSELEKEYERLVNHFYKEVLLPWVVYKEMFSNQKYIDILNDYENSLFICISQKSINDSIILSINRLIEKRKNDSLTLNYFKSKLSTNTLKKEIGNSISTLIKEFKKYKQYRNKKLAHFDIDYQKIKYIGVDIDKIIKMITDILDFIREKNSFSLESPYLSESIIIGNITTTKIISNFMFDIKSFINKESNQD